MFAMNIVTPYEVIYHFDDFLLVNLNDELLLPSMYSHGLLTDHDLELITTGPTSYHRNSLILRCVQHMSNTELATVIEVLQENHSDIWLPLTNGKLLKI